jgi:hypothetical protein
MTVFSNPLLGLVAVFLLLGFHPAHAGGLSWGDFGGNDTTESSCAPDKPLVITPGPLGSPLRIARLDTQTSVVADYTRNIIYKVDLAGSASPFIKTSGKPLSIAVATEAQKQNKRGKVKRNKQVKATYFVGNEDTLSIDAYRVKGDKITLLDRHFTSDDGIQALDMAVAAKLQQLFVVDGVSRSIKVLNYRGTVLRSFGGDSVLSSPKGIAVDVVSGEIFVSDYGDSRVGIPASIKVFDLSGRLRTTITGSFSRPQGLALTNDKLFVADNMLSQILEFDRSTKQTTKSYACQGSSEGHLLLPMDVAVDGEGLNLYVADNRNMRITVLPLSEGK